MERTAWTDGRLDDLAQRMDAGFARVDARFDRVEGDIRELGAELRAELRAEIGSLRMILARTGGGIIVALIGVIAAIVAAG